MIQPEVTCSCCGGKGHRKLPKKLNKSYQIAVALLKDRPNFSVSDFATKADCELTAAHHRIKRMVAMKVLKRQPKVTPARYLTV